MSFVSAAFFCKGTVALKYTVLWLAIFLKLDFMLASRRQFLRLYLLFEYSECSFYVFIQHCQFTLSYI